MASTSALPSTPPNQWTVHFTAKGSNQALTMPRDITVAELLQRILAITNAIPTSFRVLCGGVLIKATAGVDEIALEKYSGLKDGVKVQVMGDELDLLVGVPAETRDLWREAAKQLTENKSIAWKTAADSLEAVKDHFSDEQARNFASRHMHFILSIMTAQNPSKVGPHERMRVKQTLRLAAEIVSMHLQTILVTRAGAGGNLLDSLEHIFNPKATYMAGATTSGGRNYSGITDCTVQNIADWFSECDGFVHLATYMSETIGSSDFPSPNVVANVVDLLSGTSNHTKHESLQNKPATATIIKASIDHISMCDKDYVFKMAENEGVMSRLRRILLQAVRSETTATDCDEWQLWNAWSSVVLRMTDTKLLPGVRKTGWAAWHDMMQWSVETVNSNEQLIVGGAGLDFVNGLYTPVKADKDGVAYKDGVVYTRTVPDGFGEASGTTLTCRACIMRSGQKWWFISKEDEEQPGTDRDVDYYHLKNAGNTAPLLDGWIVSREHGMEPAPTLQLTGTLGLPKDQSTPFQFCHWAQENQLFARAESDCAYSEYISGAKDSAGLYDFLPLLRYGMSEEARSFDFSPDARFRELYREVNTCKAETVKALKVLESSNSSAQFVTAFITIGEIVENIMTKSDEKYRKIKVRNAQFQQKLGGCQGSDQLMRSVGFDRSQGSYGVEYYAFRGSIFGLLAVKTSLNENVTRSRESTTDTVQRVENMIAVDRREAQMLETAIMRSLADAALPPGE